MIASKIIDSIQRCINGGSTNVGDSIDPLYLKNMLNGYRSAEVMSYYKKNHFIDSSCYQRYYLTLNQQLQQYAPQGSLVFQIPKIIALGQENGIRFAGNTVIKNINGCNEAMTTQWRQISNRSYLASMQMNDFTRLSNHSKKVYFLVDNGNARMEIYNDLSCTEGFIEGVFSNPFDIPTFNEDTDDYPLDENAIPLIIDMVWQDRMEIIKATRKEIKQNVPENEIAVPPKKIQQTQQQ